MFLVDQMWLVYQCPLGLLHRHWHNYPSFMMMSSNGNIFRVTGHLCGEFTGIRWIPAQKPVMWSLVFSLICSWIKDWVNNSEAGDLRCHHTHCDITVMFNEVTMAGDKQQHITTKHNKVKTVWILLRMLCTMCHVQWDWYGHNHAMVLTMPVMGLAHNSAMAINWNNVNYEIGQDFPSAVINYFITILLTWQPYSKCQVSHWLGANLESALNEIVTTNKGKSSDWSWYEISPYYSKLIKKRILFTGCHREIHSFSLQNHGWNR